MEIPELPKPSYSGKCPSCSHQIADASYTHDPDESFDADETDYWPGNVNQIHALKSCPNCGIKIDVSFRVEIEVTFSPKIEVMLSNADEKYIEWANNRAIKDRTQLLIDQVDQSQMMGKWDDRKRD